MQSPRNTPRQVPRMLSVVFSFRCLYHAGRAVAEHQFKAVRQPTTTASCRSTWRRRDARLERGRQARPDFEGNPFASVRAELGLPPSPHSLEFLLDRERALELGEPPAHVEPHTEMPEAHSGRIEHFE